MRIKVCCIQSVEEAQLAIQHGAHALGLVAEMPTGTGVIGDEEIRRIADSIPPTYSSVLLTSRTNPDAIVEHQRATGANTLQLVGAINPRDVRKIRGALPGISLVKVIHVQDSNSVELAVGYLDVADALLLDTKIKTREGEALGGTGMTHDWSISRRIVEASTRPVFLAGGLSPENVAAAIRAVRPFGVDVCSSLRPNGTLDPIRLREFISRSSVAAA